VFADLDETLRHLLVQNVPVDISEVDISFEAPDREWSGRLSRPSINCFLYDVYENQELRDSNWEMRRVENSAARRRPPMRIDATYQVTTWARAPEDEHRLLWRVLVALTRHLALPPDSLQGGLVDQPYPLYTRVAQAEQKARINAADLWQALDNRIRPSLTYVVTLTLDPHEALTSPLVFSREVRLQQINGHASSGDLAAASVDGDQRNSNPSSN
jgi:hypothetical protein